jgi:hypothetical protein
LDYTFSSYNDSLQSVSSIKGVGSGLGVSVFNSFEGES